MNTPPRLSEANGPRFTELFNSVPPYEQYHLHLPDSPPIPQYASDQGVPQITHRLSNKERPISPELRSPGLESVWAGESEKEVLHPPLQPQPCHSSQQQQQQQATAGRRVCGMVAKWFCILLVAIFLLAIGLGVGLGIGLSRQSSSPSSSSTSPSSPSSTNTAPLSSPTVNAEYLIGGALNPAYYSTQGAFNGSGIALATQSFAPNLQAGARDSLVMYFQHHSGEIRWQQLSASGKWQGGSVSEVVAVDAKNSTPLSAVAYALNGSSTWHIFYIDAKNQIKQRTNSNTTNLWVDGPINQMNLTANNADTVGMQACWYGNDYGDSDYAHTLPPSSGGDTTFSSEVGMHIWYASDDTTFQQLGWRDGDATWGFQQSWTNLNGHAGVGCYSWSPGSVTYVMFVDRQNTVNIWWKDTNTTLKNSTRHPINVWTNTSIAINNVNPATSLGYTNYFYAQMASNNMLNGYNISWAAENTTILPGSGNTFTVQGAPGVSGTHFSVSALPNTSGGNVLIVFYQTNGSDISVYTRDLVAGQWTGNVIPIPVT